MKFVILKSIVGMKRVRLRMVDILINKRLEKAASQFD